MKPLRKGTSCGEDTLNIAQNLPVEIKKQQKQRQQQQQQQQQTNIKKTF